jgi:hypothetical protein
MARVLLSLTAKPQQKTLFSVGCLPVDFHSPEFHLRAVTYSAPQSLAEVQGFWVAPRLCLIIQALLQAPFIPK